MPANRGRPKVTGAPETQDSRRLIAHERARELKIRNDKAEGKLMDAQAAANLYASALRVARDAILNVPARVSAELAALTDPAAVHARLDAELRLALEAGAEQMGEENG